MTEHFRRALAVLREHRWLVIFPFLMAVMQLLVDLPRIFRLQYQQLEAGGSSALQWPFSGNEFVRSALHQVVPAMHTALRYATGPIGGTFISSVWSLAIVALFTLTIALLPAKPDWLLPALKNNPKEFRLVKLIGSVSLVLLAIGIFMFVYTSYAMTQWWSSRELYRFWTQTVVFLPGFLLALSEIWILALLSSVYCAAIVNAQEGRSVNFSELVRQGLARFPAMFLFEFVLTGVNLIVQVLILAHPRGGIHSSIFDPWSYVFWIDMAIQAALAGIPLLIVRKRLKPTEIFEAHADFLMSNFGNYLFFILAGSILLFLPIYMGRVFDLFVARWSVLYFDLQIVIYAIESFITAWYAVAYLDWVRQPSVP